MIYKANDRGAESFRKGLMMETTKLEAEQGPPTKPYTNRVWLEDNKSGVILIMCQTLLGNPECIGSMQGSADNRGVVFELEGGHLIKVEIPN